MSFFRRLRASNAVPQSQPLDARQRKNDAGGYAFELAPWDALERFLIIGSEGGTYYVAQDELTERATALVQQCLREDGPRAVEAARRVSHEALAIKQDYALYTLALALAGDDVTTRRAAYRALPDICRTASTLFQLLSYLKGRRGWSRGLRNAVAKWYDDRPVDELAYQLVKYRSRHEFTHRDVMRLAHPNGDDDRERRQALYAWAATKPYEAATLPSIVRTYEAARAETSGDARLGLAATLPREALPTEWLNDPRVWEALLHPGENGTGMPATALLRNLANLSKHGVLVADSPATEIVAQRLEDGAHLRAARVHPIAIYLAAATYAPGRGVKGSGTWAPVGKIVNALDRAFELAFANVRPTGKRVLVAVDVSGSMAGARVANTTLTAAKVASAMAFVTAKTEPGSEMIGFDWAPGKGRYASYGAYPLAAGRSPSGVYAYEIAPDERLRDFQARFTTPGGGTDCSLPVQYAIDRGKDLDAIVIFTDNETWAGDRHPQAVLETYRKHVRHRVKVVVAAVTATQRTIADPEDRDVLQIAGFSADVPTVINDFLRR